MQPYSSPLFFFLIFSFIFFIWIIQKQLTEKCAPIIFSLASFLFSYAAQGDLFCTFLLFIFYQMLIILLASKFVKTPKLFFIFAIIIPLFILKVSETFESIKFANEVLKIIGISYITFRSIQIVLDLSIYKPKNYFNIFFYFTNPLTLLAGPIDRFNRFELNLISITKSLTKENFIRGWYFLIVGCLQKFIFAHFWDIEILRNFPINSERSIDIIGRAYSYAVFLFFDFSGYSLMAIGLSLMMGILLPSNFDKPWESHNPNEFWKRFHITLGEFLNDYFFKPIYLKILRINYFSNHRLTAQNLSIFLTFLLMGAWNGLKWNYLLSGMMFGLSSICYNTYKFKYNQSSSFFLKHNFLILYRFIFLNYVIWALYFFNGINQT